MNPSGKNLKAGRCIGRKNHYVIPAFGTGHASNRPVEKQRAMDICLKDKPTMKSYDTRYGLPWNMLLITIGASILGLGIKAVAIPHGFITGGTSGLGLLVYYATGLWTPGTWYLLLNIPIFIIGWCLVSRRFFYYSLYGMLVLAGVLDLISLRIPIHEPILAVLAAGCLVGAGSGIIFHSLGSVGGMDILAVLLNQRFNIPIGRLFFMFNMTLFTFSLGFLKVDQVLFSLAISFIVGQVTDYFLSIFNQRKLVLVISDRTEEMAGTILHTLKRGATFLEGTGAYTGKRKKILMTVINNHQLKRMEEAVFTIDPDAMVITENTFNVLGKGFSHRKIY
jgi:uncharacterized membrane-anchored protein YitT (DUF2179 family)